VSHLINVAALGFWLFAAYWMLKAFHHGHLWMRESKVPLPAIAVLGLLTLFMPFLFTAEGNRQHSKVAWSVLWMLLGAAAFVLLIQWREGRTG